MSSELVCRVLCPHRGVINSARVAFKMSAGVVTGHRFDTPLKFHAIFPQVMPQSCHSRPISTAEESGMFFCKFSHLSQVLIEVVQRENIAVTPNVGQMAGGLLGR